MTQVAEIKSPHEQRLEDNIAGKEDIYRESHKRVFKLLERFDGQKPATSNALCTSRSPWPKPWVSLWFSVGPRL